MNLVKTESFLLRKEDLEIDKSVVYSQQICKEHGRKFGDPEIDVVNHNYSYFACTCGAEDKKYWKDRLNAYLPEFDPEIHACMSSQLCAEITHNFNGCITGIDMDMWFGISASGTLWLDDTYTTYVSWNISMQCDEIVFGLMAIVDILRAVMEEE